MKINYGKARKMTGMIMNAGNRTINKSEIGRSLWKGMAVPYCLYGSDVTYYWEGDLAKLERMQNTVGRWDPALLWLLSPTYPLFQYPRHFPEAPFSPPPCLCVTIYPSLPVCVCLPLPVWGCLFSSCGVGAGLPLVVLVLVLLWCRCWSSCGVAAGPFVVLLLVLL